MTYHGNVGRVNNAKVTALSVGDLWVSRFSFCLFRRLDEWKVWKSRADVD